MHKFRAKKTDCLHGHTHDSNLEAGRCDALHALEAEGMITDLSQQPEFPVMVNGKLICKYVADFQYQVQDCRIIEDCKGVQTRVFSIKRKLVEAAYPGTVITLYPPVKRKARKKRAA